MTKPRVPHSWADAVTRIAGLIGWDAAAAAVGRSEAMVRKWSDPATGKRPSLDQACALSVAYARAGGEDAPFVDAMAFQVGAAVAERDACRLALVQEAGTLAREIGEAIAFALALTKSTASPLDAFRAFAEMRQAGSALDALLLRLAQFLPSDTGSDAGTVGGPQ